MISIVIPNYNGFELLQRNLPKLLVMLQKSKLGFELIIVDDLSTDLGVKTFLQKFAEKSSQIRVVFKDTNEGFASTAHRGFVEAKGEFVFVIKNDAIPENEKYFPLLLKHFEDPKIFAVSAALKTVEKGKEELRGQGVIYYEKGFLLHKRAGEGANELRDPSTRKLAQDDKKITAWADGGASVFRRDIYFKLGGFDPIFNPAYWEDTDLGYRAWKAGYECLWEPKAVLLHEYEMGSVKKKYGAEKVKLMSLKHQFDFLWCNADLKYILLYILWLPYHYAVSIKNGDFSFIKAHLMSEANSLDLFQARWKRKKLHKISDDEVLERF